MSGKKAGKTRLRQLLWERVGGILGRERLSKCDIQSRERESGGEIYERISDIIESKMIEQDGMPVANTLTRKSGCVTNDR